MSFLVDPPRPIEVRTDSEGNPEHVNGWSLDGWVRPVQHWVAEVDWWNRPVSRQYWRVLLLDQLLCEIYHDHNEGAWFIERIYD